MSCDLEVEGILKHLVVSNLLLNENVDNPNPLVTWQWRESINVPSTLVLNKS